MRTAIEQVSPGAIWPPPPMREGGECTETIEGTILISGPGALLVNLTRLRRSFGVSWGLAALLVTQAIARLIFERNLHSVDVAFIILTIVAAAVGSALNCVAYEFQFGRCRYIFDRTEQCLIAAGRREKFAHFSDVSIRSSGRGYLVYLAATASDAPPAFIHLLPRWLENWLRPGKLGRYRDEGNARRVAEIVAEATGLKIAAR